jgi:hypothetical protein
MQTNIKSTTDKTRNGQALSQSELKRWNVLLDGEVIGSIHGQTEAQARDTIAPFRMSNLTVAPFN